MQTVDPFVPINKGKPAQKPVPAGQYGTKWFNQTAAAKYQPVPPKPIGRSIDGIAKAPNRPLVHPQTPQTTPSITQPKLTPAKRKFFDVRAAKKTSVQHPVTSPASSVLPVQTVPKPEIQPAARPKVTTKKSRSLRGFFRTIQWPAIILGVVIIGLLAQTLLYGELAIAAYGLFALVERIESRTTFTLALLSFIGIVVLYLLYQGGTLANNFAVYAFLFLVIGTISLGIELYHRDDTKHIKTSE